MAKDDHVQMTGEITDTFRGGKFKVVTDEGLTLTCTQSGKIRMNSITLIQGDRVEVGVSPYDMTKGIINRRLK